jgi:hypothetical protein
MSHIDGVPVPADASEAHQILHDFMEAQKTILIHMQKCRRANNRRIAEAAIITTGALISLDLYFRENHPDKIG